MLLRSRLSPVCVLSIRGQPSGLVDYLSSSGVTALPRHAVDIQEVSAPIRRTVCPFTPPVCLIVAAREISGEKLPFRRCGTVPASNIE